MVVQDKTFFITGGGSGLGAAVGRHLLERGANVVFGDIDVTRARDAAALGGEHALAVEVDVTLAASVEAAIALAIQRFGALHGVVNCAGIAPAQRIVGKDGAHSLDLFAKVVSVNLIGTFNVMRLAAVAMANNTPDAGGERGVIVNTASVAAYDGQIGQSAYAASKARNGIRVVTVAPGIFETPMLLAMPAEVQQALGAGVPFPQRLGQPAEFAALVEHIVGNRYLNGEVIRLDGALRMAPR
ncbi:SDR family NAD(P)-dependent oxidoreductase [Paraburkholderia sp. BR14262]|uniref:SDR family NAD(P)-dependent oxidoreductase n=1 Tax=Paraburkholderia sp. BR14262 TaxID=3236999 RepID=UPI0034CE0C6B